MRSQRRWRCDGWLTRLPRFHAPLPARDGGPRRESRPCPLSGLKLHSVGEIDFSRFDLIALVDTQPGTGNNSLPPEVTPHIVIDHHPLRKATRGSSSAMFVAAAALRRQYSISIWSRRDSAGYAAGDGPAVWHTLGYAGPGREATKADVKPGSPCFLWPICGCSATSSWRGAAGVVSDAAGAIESARVYGRAIVTHLGAVENPDMVGEVADLLLREEQTLWTMARASSRRSCC